MSTMQKENAIQAEALRQMKGDEVENALEHGASFRETIEAKKADGKEATADDLIWIESEKAGENLRKEKTT